MAYAVTASVSAIGNNRLMPDADYSCKVINGKNGFVRDNTSWIIGRIVRDFETWMDDCPSENKSQMQSKTPIQDCLDEIGGNQKRPAGLCVSIYTAEEAHLGHPGYDGSYFAGFVTGMVQLALAAIPYCLFGNWAILLVTAVGIALAFASGALPQWAEEKWACRFYTKKTIILTRGNGSQHAFVILGNGLGMDLENLAAANSALSTSRLTRFTTLILAMLWILLLITASGIKDDTWFLLAIGGIGILDNIYVAGSSRSPKDFGIPLKFKEVIGNKKVMKALLEVEEKYPRVGRSMLATFFPGDLRQEEQDKWDHYAARDSDTPSER